jgi:parallel beta-helix repeat protein
MNKKWVAAGIIFLFIEAIIIPSTGPLTARYSSPMSNRHMLYVGGSGPGNYSKIQDAINNSSGGDTVFVYHGSYYEKVVIKKSISVCGENASRTFINYTLEPNWWEQVVLICSHDAIFSGFTVVLEQGDSVGIRLKDARNCIISYNIIRASFGMCLYNSSYTTIESNSFFTIVAGIQIALMSIPSASSYNIIRYNWFTNIGDYPNHSTNCGIWMNVYTEENIIRDNYFYHCTYYAIYSYSPYRNFIEQNVIRQNISYGTGIAIYLEYGEHFPPGNIIRQNDIAGCSLGISLKGDYFTVENNFIHDNDWGMEISTFYLYHVNVNNNTFLNDSNALDMMYGNNDSVVERNWFHKCGYALSLYQCHRLIIRYNNFTSNERAVVPVDASLNNISQNNFIGNRHYVKSILSRNIWWGNYWNRPRFLPKIIVGILPFIQFDSHPAQKPN